MAKKGCLTPWSSPKISLLWPLRVILVAGLFGIFPANVTAQQLAPLFSPAPRLGGQGISFGVDKIANTFLFTGTADFELGSDVGTFRIINNYRGTAFRTSTVALRDDEFSSLSWTKAVAEDVTAVVRQTWTLSRDSRSLGLSSLERLNGAAGLQWHPHTAVSVEALAGAERTTQIGVGATGFLMGIDARIRDMDLDDWSLTSHVLADYHRMDAKRTSSDVNVETSVLRTLDERSALRIAAHYTSLGRDYFTTVVLGSADLVVESRSEQRLGADASLTYALAAPLTAVVNAQLSASAIDRRFAEAAALTPITAVNRRLSELVVDISGELQLQLPRVNASVGVAVYSRDEQNDLTQLFALDASAVATLRSQENQRDNATTRTRLQARGAWTPSDRDTLEGELTTWLLRYNTPSDLNADDRDELSAAAAVRYAHRVSSGLSVGLSVGAQEVHLVFLKAQRSALNNVNRVIRFGPFLHIQGKVLTMHPQFEVLANYTVYDFEDRGASARSFSFRQLAWRDSLRLQFTPTLHAEGIVLYRYSERATLYWRQFAESPEAGLREWLAKVLIFSTPSTGVAVGAGVRRYELVQRPLGALAGSPGTSGSLRFWAPETAVRYVSSNGSTLSLSGWYEIQEVNDTGRRNLPNLLLHAQVLF